LNDREQVPDGARMPDNRRTDRRPGEPLARPGSVREAPSIVRILLTNDDGISSDGLWAAARGLARVGHLTVIGTVDDWSGGGASIRMTVGARLQRYANVPDDLGPDVEAYSIEAAPGGAILAGVMSDLFEPFDLVASGANYGINVGGDLVFSGTVGAAATGHQRGLPAFAISVERGVNRGQPQRWDVVSDASERIARWFANRSGPPVLLNVNVPNRPFAETAGAKLVSPARWANLDRARFVVRSEDDGGWRVSAVLNKDLPYPDDEQTDAGAVLAGWIAVSQVVPTGFAPQPILDDLAELIASLGPGGAGAPII
jgi:5'-nucleotidase